MVPKITLKIMGNPNVIGIMCLCIISHNIQSTERLLQIPKFKCFEDINYLKLYGFNMLYVNQKSYTLKISDALLLMHQFQEPTVTHLTKYIPILHKSKMKFLTQ